MTKFRIIGSGVIGLTTGIYLNLSGYDTDIITENIPVYGENYLNKSDAKTATEYAAASVKPAAIPKNNKDFLNSMLEESIMVYNTLESMYPDMVYSIPHYSNKDSHFYSDVVRNYREGLEKIVGGVKSSSCFKVHMVDMPEYIKYLIEKYRSSGGKIIEENVKNLDKHQKECEYVINCTGCGSRQLLDDEDSLVEMKGHLAYVEQDPESIMDKNPISYVYNIDGNTVYCYPQKERLVLGGTAITDPDKNFDYYEFDGQNIPKHIISENRKILLEHYNVDILDFDIFGVSGYRPYRESGIRIEKDGNIIHNYGHGGSGITLCWGSAREVLKIIDKTI